VERKNLPTVWHTTEQDWNSGWLSRESEALATAPLSNAPMHQCTNAPMRHCCFATMRKIVWIKPARRGLFVASCPVDLARSVHRCVTDSRGATTHSPLERESGETEKWNDQTSCSNNYPNKQYPGHRQYTIVIRNAYNEHVNRTIEPIINKHCKHRTS
jgi:hypothetical protein